MSEEKKQHKKRKVLADFFEPPVNTVTEEQLKTLTVDYYKAKTNKKEAEFAHALRHAKRFSPSVSEGLNDEQVNSRKEEKLVNIATAKSGKSYAAIVSSNLVTFFNIFALIIFIALIMVGSYGDLVFMIIIFANVSIGIFQEIRAKIIVERISLLTSPKAVVVRNGYKQVIKTSEVVLDDIIYLESGKQVPTDGIVLVGEVEVNEALLTGESVSVQKSVDNELYAGSYVTSGSCYMSADKVGNANYIEMLTAAAKRFKKSKSELVRSLKRFITAIGGIIVPVTVLMFLVNYNSLNGDLTQVIPKTAGSAIGMIPAGMFFLTTIALAVSVINLTRNKVLVQDQYCIEMLARTNVLCLDKTGTITDGTMLVERIMQLKKDLPRRPEEILGNCMTATLDNNTTAMAILNYCGSSTSMNPTSILNFSSERKYSAVSFEGEGTYFVGAPEFVCKKLDKSIASKVNDLSKDGYRVILLAHSEDEMTTTSIPEKRKPIAIITIVDHIREDAIETINWFKNNDVEIKVISGDNPLTVSEIARRVGIANHDRFISLEGLTDKEVAELAKSYTIFGRVTPEQKRILIKALKAYGKTVAMTGDGVNDILALKESDCGIAMASGSEATRNVAHMVLMDSNFNNMPKVVFEGRKVINNIQRSSSLFLMKTLFSIFLSMFVISYNLRFVFTSAIAGPNASYPFGPSQMALLELLVIGFPSLMLAFQSNSKRIEGNFISSALQHSMPGGLTLFISYLALLVYDVTATLPREQYIAMSVIIVTYTGFMLLVKLCQPVNGYRAVLCAISGTAILTALLLMPNYLQIVKLEFANLLFCIVVICVGYFVASMLEMLITFLIESSQKNKERHIKHF